MSHAYAAEEKVERRKWMTCEYQAKSARLISDLIARVVEMCDYTNSAVISVWPSNELRVLTQLIRISSLSIGISKR